MGAQSSTLTEVDDRAPVLRSALAVFVLAITGAALVFGVRVASVCDGEVACTVIAGSNFTDPSEAAIPVVDGDGYDGQFYFRQARSPFDLSSERVNGVLYDTEVRYGRVGYPVLVWAIALGGQATLVPWGMAAVNIAAIGFIAAALSTAAMQAGRSRWWGVTAALVPGLWWAMGRDLADPTAAAFTAGAVLLIGRRRWAWAAACFCLAALTKEQAIIVPAAYGLWRLWVLIRRPGSSSVDGSRTPAVAPSGPPGRPVIEPFGIADLPWMAPAAVFAAWQVVLWALLGVLPALKAGGRHVVAPFSSIVPSVVDWLSPEGATQLLWLAEIVVLLLLASVVLTARSSLGWERLVGAAAMLLLIVLNENVFIDPAHFRQFSELTVVLLMAAFRAPPRRWMPLVGVQCAVALVVIARLWTVI